MKNYKIDSIKLMAAITAELNRQHPGIPADNRINIVIQAANMVAKEYGRQVRSPYKGMNLNDWLECDDVGASSKYMASVMSGAFNAPHAYPRDPDDFGRCIRLVDSVVMLGLPVSTMAGHGPEWAAVAKNWDAWSELYISEQYAELYSAMRAAYAPGAQA